MSSIPLQHAITAAILLSLACFGIGILSLRFSTTREPAMNVKQVALPILTPLLPLGLHTSIRKFPIFLVFQQNITMLQHAFDSAQEAFPDQVVLIDNSPSGDIATSPDFRAAAGIWHSVVYLSFPQLHNMMAALAATWGFELYGWMHADAVVLQLQPQENLGDYVAKTLMPLGSDWAVAFTIYDVLAFYNTRVVLKEPWDEDFLQNYAADCDAYHRWQLHGHQVGGLVGFEDHMSIVHLADVPPQRWGQMTHQQRLQVYEPLDKANHPSNIEPNQWKWSGKSRARDMATQRHRFEAAKEYYFEKWNTSSCDLPPTAQPLFKVPPSILYSVLAGKAEAEP